MQNLSELEQGIVSGFLLIFFSELGDKTFFIALLLSLKQAKPIVFAGTFGALAIMTVISVRPPKCCSEHCKVSQIWSYLLRCWAQVARDLLAENPIQPCRNAQVALGELIHKADQVLPFNGLPVDDILATVLLIFFGIRTLQVCFFASCAPCMLCRHDLHTALQLSSCACRACTVICIGS